MEKVKKIKLKHCSAIGGQALENWGRGRRRGNRKSSG